VRRAVTMQTLPVGRAKGSDPPKAETVSLGQWIAVTHGKDSMGTDPSSLGFGLSRMRGR